MRLQKMKILMFVALFAAVSCKSIKFNEELDDLWESFKKVFEKSYAAEEETFRRLIWEKHVSDIYLHNLRANLGLHSFHKGLNKYSDMSFKERAQKMRGFRGQSSAVSNASTWLDPANVIIPDRVDWREEGFVTPVKDQGQCGSCWAFSSTGSLEGQHKRKTGQLVSLSEQNLVDCSGQESNGGCSGGWMDQAFEYVVINKGIDTEESYPYVAFESVCRYRSSGKGATCTGYVDIPQGDEEALKKAVATVGPVSVAINVEDDFYDYKQGVYDTSTCLKDIKDLTHAVLVVGYGTENGKDYWLVKNSWSATWGNNGYIKMARNKNNQCGIATKASYPLV